MQHGHLKAETLHAIHPFVHYGLHDMKLHSHPIHTL